MSFKIFILPKTHFFFRSEKDVQHLIHSFPKKIRIHYFGWTRLYNDGYRASLTNRSDWVRHYYEQGYYNYAKCDRHPSCYQSGYTIWDLWDRDSKSHEIISKDSRENFNLSHGVSFIRKNEIFADVFDFCSHASDYDINGYYINNVALFEEFIDFFYEKTFLIKNAVDNKFEIKYDDSVDIHTEENDLVLIPITFKTNQLLDIAHIDYKTEKLTPRQIECLHFLVIGKTADEIALILGISKRTAEKHIEAIKIKLKCNTLFQTGLKVGCRGETLQRHFQDSAYI